MSPLWNFTPLRSVKSYTRPSGDICHDSARLGAVGFPGIALASASWSAYMTMNGVMIPCGLGGIEPRRRERDVHAPRHLALGGGSGGRGDREQNEQDERGNDSEMAQGLSPHGKNSLHGRCPDGTE